jgi:hypothetical protein
MIKIFEFRSNFGSLKIARIYCQQARVFFRQVNISKVRLESKKRQLQHKRTDGGRIPFIALHIYKMVAIDQSQKESFGYSKGNST